MHVCIIHQVMNVKGIEEWLVSLEFKKCFIYVLAKKNHMVDAMWPYLCTHLPIVLIMPCSRHVVKLFLNSLKMDPHLSLHASPFFMCWEKTWNNDNNRNIFSSHDYSFKLVAWTSSVQCHNMFVLHGLDEGHYLTIFLVLLLRFYLLHFQTCWN
jgi:hypothetical protein